MLSGILRRAVDPIETEVQSRPSAAEFEMAYQAGSRLTESSSQSGTPNSSAGPATRCAKQACNCSTHSNALKCSTAAFKYGLEWPLPQRTEGRRRRGHESRCCRKPFQTPGFANAAHWTLRFRNTDESYERSD